LFHRLKLLKYVISCFCGWAGANEPPTRGVIASPNRLRVLVPREFTPHGGTGWELTRCYPFGGCPLSVPKLSSVLLQILLEFVCRLSEVVCRPLISDQFTASAVVDVVGVLIVVADELKQVSPLPQGVDEDLVASCYFHLSTSSFGGLPFLSSWCAICSHERQRSSQSSIEVGVCRLPFMW